ncbi:MAG: LysM peptidoglycan-binding domain-containing protein [Aggregatilineales bacterium]
MELRIITLLTKIRAIIAIFTLILLTGCASSNEPRVVFITATPVQSVQAIPATNPPVTTVAISPTEVLPPIVQDNAPTPDSPRFTAQSQAQQTDDEYVIQAGDTLSAVATRYGINVNILLELNDIADPNTLFVGQVIRLPGIPVEQTPLVKLISDHRFVRGPGSNNFDIDAFIQQQAGYIRVASDEVITRLANGQERREVLGAGEIIQRISLEFSVDPRLLLALLEYRAGWLSQSQIAGERVSYPLISELASGAIDRSGLYKQLAWASNILNYGYYGWKFNGWTALTFSDSTRLLYAEGLNAASVGLQYFLSQNQAVVNWRQDVALTGFYTTYVRYFGDPFTGVLEPLVASSIVQPSFTLPFSSGETWFYTGGAHGGWGAGSAWSAIDFAPPDEPPDGIFCYTSNYWVTAVSSGIITHSDNGMVILDVDGDADDTTGWSVIYLHLAESGRIASGTVVSVGDQIGRPSCEGGFSTATHMHIARRYNGEWIPADCQICPPQFARPQFNMSGWNVIGILNQEYQGFLENNNQRRVAEQGRLTPENRISW